MELRGCRFKAMGSPCEVRLYGEPDGVEAGLRAALAEVARLERKYSRYRDDSVCTAINRSAGGPRGVEVDDETAALLDYGQTVFEQSGGVFDVTSGILRQAWDFRSGRLPEESDLEPLLERVHDRHGCSTLSSSRCLSAATSDDEVEEHGTRRPPTLPA